MLQDMVHQPTEQIPIEEISSPLNAQIFDFCESELFQETLQNSEVASNSNCCYEEHSPYTANHSSLLQDMSQFTNSIVVKDENPETPPINTATANQSNLSVVFDSSDDIDNDISVSIDFSTHHPTSASFSIPQYLTTTNNNNNNNNNQQQDHHQFDYSLPQYPTDSSMVQQLMAPPPPLPSVYEEECLSAVPSYMRHLTATTTSSSPSPSCSLLDPTTAIGPFLHSNLTAALTSENPGIFNGNTYNMFMGADHLPTQELDFQGESVGIFCPETMHRAYNCPNELQAITNESQHLVNGGASSTPLAPEISSLEDPTFKVGKLTVEERREKIHRYMKKRNERNFSKKIKYACRKTLADSRPRVRGRFAKNDELEMARTTCSISNHEEDTDEDMVVKEEDDMVDSSDIFAHISGVNSFKCNNPLQSWI